MNVQAREAAAVALRAWAWTVPTEPDELYLERLRVAWRNDMDQELATAAARTLLTLGYWRELVERLKYKDGPAQTAAAIALRAWPRQVGEEADEETKAALRLAVASPVDTEWRIAAAVALGRCGELEDLQTLRRLRRESTLDEILRGAIEKALNAIEEWLHLPPETALSRVRMPPPVVDQRSLSQVETDG